MIQSISSIEVFQYKVRHQNLTATSPLWSNSGHSSPSAECPLLDQSGQRSILAGDVLSANDPKRTSVRVKVYRQAAIYVDRILRGAKPTEFLIQVSKFELVINLKTANT